MELLLIVVSVVSLGLAVTMSVIAWRLLQGDHQRAAARVEALTALAFAGDSEPPGPTADWDAALGSSVTPVRGAMFDSAPAAGIAHRRWLAVAAVGAVVSTAVGVAYALRSPAIVSAIAASPAVATNGPHRDVRPIELLSLRHSTDALGAFAVTGLVRNPADGGELNGVEAVVYLFDENGQFLVSGRAGLDLSAFQPGAESAFVVKVVPPAGIGRYRVGFRRSDGRVVAHVDRRGQFPSGTTADVVATDLDVAGPARGMRPADRIGAP